MTTAAKSTAHSVVEASSRVKAFAAIIVILYAVTAITPLLWIVATAFKSQSDAIAYPPKVIFQPTLEGYVNLFTVRTRQTRANSSPTCRRRRPGTTSSFASTKW